MHSLTSRIIEPVASRCSKFRFRPLEQSSSQARIEMIANNEGVQADPGVLELILQLAGGDLRKAITYLQTAQRLHQASDPPTPITAMSGESPRPARTVPPPPCFPNATPS